MRRWYGGSSPDKTEMPKIKVSAEEGARKWKTRLDGAIDEIRAGVDKVTEAPGVKAAAASDKMRARIIEAIDTGRWGAEVSKVTLPEWKAAMADKGIPRIRAGTEAALDEVTAFNKALYSHIEAGQSAIEGKPSLTLEDNIDRMVTFIRHMSTMVWKGR